MSYCRFVSTVDKDNVHRRYHDHAYGFPIHDDNELFCRLVLEINQAGLSWETILKKQDNFRKAYRRFNIRKVSLYSDSDRVRLLADAGLIRIRLQLNSAIENSKTILMMQNEHGSFEKWSNIQHPKASEEWVKVFRKTFLFTGGGIVGEFLMSIGILPGAHDKKCPIFKKILRARPWWAR